MAPELMMDPNPILASLPTYASGIICTPGASWALASIKALGIVPGR
jgi:hypothetical protein